MDSLQSVKRQKSFRRWIKKVTTPKVAPLLYKGADGKQQQQQGVFGVPLVVSISYARGTVGYQDTDQVNHQSVASIPLIVSKCGSYLKRNGLETEGIFRLSASTKRVNALQQIFDSPLDSYGLHHDWKGYTVHDAGSALRRYFLQLPDPVIPTSFYQPFRNVMTDDSVYKTTDQRVDALQALIRQLPTAHQHLLLYILDMLRFFAVNSSVTRMDASNLAAVFSPGLLSHPQHNTPTHYMISQRVIEFLIEYQNLFTMDLLVDSNVDDIKSPVGSDEALVSPNIPRRSSTPSALPSPANSLQSIGVAHEKSMNRHSLPPTPISPTTTDTRALAFPSLPSSPRSSHRQQQDHTRTNVQTIAEQQDKVDISSSNTFKNQYLTSIIKSYHQQTDQAIRRLDHWWNHIFNPLLLGWYLTVGIIASTLIYEGYLLCGTFTIIEPCVFFTGFSGFWLLLLHGTHTPSLEQQHTTSNNTLSADDGSDDDHNPMDELSLFNDISLNEDTDNEDKPGMELIHDNETMANWQQLISRSWRAPPNDDDDNESATTTKQEHYPALGHDSNIGSNNDGASMISMASRFVEDDDHQEDEYDGYRDGDEELSLGSATDEDLQHLWARYDQFKQDQALAEKLQQEEQVRSLEMKKQGDVYNPFLQDN